MGDIPRGARPHVKARSTPDLEKLIDAAAKASHSTSDELCSCSKKSAIVMAKEAMILVAHELGASNAAIARQLGANSSAVSRRLDSAKSKIKDSSELQKLVKLITDLIGKVELKD